MKAHQKSLTLRNHELIVFFFLVTTSHFSGVVTLNTKRSRLCISRMTMNAHVKAEAKRT